jgi:hypothetical protein
MLRLCGAMKARKAYEANTCWCHGLFCGRGGAKATRDFRHDFPGTSALVSRPELELVMSQAHILSGNDARDRWRARLASHGAERNVSAVRPGDCWSSPPSSR